MLYKPGPDLYMMDWLCQNNHTESSDQESTGININVSVVSKAINIPVCTSLQEIQVTTQEDTHLQRLK